MPVPNLLLSALAHPERAAIWTAGEWALAIRQARSASLLASLSSRIESCLAAEAIPEPARKHFQAARNVVAGRNAAALWECRMISATLASLSIQPVLLKGAAYLAAGIPLAEHRVFSDIDLMVPKEKIADAEKQLMISGWLSANRDPSDQHYYRTWMHEIPPLQHINRGTTLDLHHTISPPTSKYQANTAKLFAYVSSAILVDKGFVLSRADMILHAATHLFAEGEADSALRNLVDIAELLQFFRDGGESDNDLVQRSVEIGLTRPLYYAIRYLENILEQDSLAELRRQLEFAAPGKLALLSLDWIYENVFSGTHPSVARWGSGLAMSALYLRGHWIRMPIHLLVPHLSRKVFNSMKPKKSAHENN